MIVAAAVTGSLERLDLVQSMMRAQVTPECGAADFLAGEGCAIGWAATCDRNAPFPFARRGAQGNLLVVTGTPIATQGSVEALLARAVDLDQQPACALLCELEGAYAILHWSSRQQTLSIVTDVLGMQPLHIARRPGAFFCSTALRGLTGASLVAPRPDAGAWGSFFAFGHVLGNRTLVEGIERAPAGSVLRVRQPGPEEQRSLHWKWPERPSAGGDPACAPIVDALERSVRAYQAYGHAGTLLMSGSFESRLVLMSLLRAGVRPRALLVRGAGRSGEADARLGRRAAELAGVAVDDVWLPPDFYRSPAYRKYLHRSELSHPPLEAVGLPGIAADPGLGCIWDGLCLHALRALPGAPTSFHAWLEQPSLRARALLVSPAPFRIGWAHAMYRDFAQLLQEEAAKYPNSEHGVLQFCVRNRTRLHLASDAYRVFAVDVLPFTPGLTREFYSLAASLTNHAKGEHRLIHRICRDFFPQALQTPFACDGELHNLSGRPSWDYTRASLMRAITVNRYASALLRRSGVVQAPVHSCPQRMRALLPDTFSDDYLDDRLLTAQPLHAEAMRKLYCWQMGRSLFPPTARAPMDAAAHAA